MTNKEYRIARERAEGAEEIYTFESEHFNGFCYFNSRYMSADDLKEMRQANKETKKELKAFALEGFVGRALIIPTETGYILRSYYTDVAEVRDGEFIRLWDGFSVTTLKHINIFRQFTGFDTMSKREWIETEVA